MKFLIVGLGNIGSEYADTRHNIGFMVLDQWAKKANFSFRSERLADIAQHTIGQHKLILIKPNTYMNLSGKAVRYWLQAEKIEVENLIIITDDLSLPTAKIRLRPKGSDGGHNGLKSITELIQTPDYARLRFGVGSRFAKGQQIEYVLGGFDEEEQAQVQQTILKSIDCIETIVRLGIEKAMNTFN